MRTRVPHDYKYHAEIQYEGETAMRFTCAVGDTLYDLFKDIDKEMSEHQQRYPEIVQVLKDPNGWNTDCTKFVVDKYYSRGNK